MSRKAGVTDRARRYRANADGARPPAPKVCVLCWSKGRGGMQVHHIDGDESNGGPENLVWCCRSCNQLADAVLKGAGLGRPTEQFNGSAGKLERFAEVTQTLRGDTVGHVSAAVRALQAIGQLARQRLAAEMGGARARRNPAGAKRGVPSAAQFAWATEWICRRADEKKGRCVRSYDEDTKAAVDIIRRTPATVRREYASAAGSSPKTSGGRGRQGVVPF